VPELPDLTVYLEHLDRLVRGQRLEHIRIVSPFVLRTVEPSVAEVSGHEVVGARRLAKQLVFELRGDYWVVIHLMISGRLQWRAPGAAIPKRNGLVAFDFSSGTLLFTESSKKKRASLRLVRGREQLGALDPGGLEIFDIERDQFAERLRSSNHTLKRALTDQRVFAGIGNAYSDEILLRARLSPFKRPRDMQDAQITALFQACRSVLVEWTDLLRSKSGSKFPTKVTAFHAEMAVHGKFKEPCPVCGAPVQRIRYAENEANYCAKCQTGGRMLADRSLSRLLKQNWPKRLEDLENSQSGTGA
jgi:formamidopyrimidine-DNA glycosylase